MTKTTDLTKSTAMSSGDDILINDDGITKRIAHGNFTLADNTLSNAKMEQVATATLKGRDTASTGAVEDLAISNLTELTDPDSTDHILVETAEGALGRMAPTSIAVSRAMQADMDTDHVMVRNTAGSGAPEDKKISELDDHAVPAVGDYVMGETAAGNLVRMDVGDLPAAEGSGEINTASNTGVTTYGLAKAKSTFDLPFKSLTSDSTIRLTANPDDVEIAIPNTAVALSKLALQADQTIVGNDSGGGSSPTALTAAEVKALLQLPYTQTIALTGTNENAIADTDIDSFTIPFDVTLTEVRAEVRTAPTGANLVVDINNPASILSGKLTILAGATASSSYTISDADLTDGDVISFDVDSIGSIIAGKGLKVTLIGYYT